MKRDLTTGDVARIAGVTAKRVAKWIDDGDLVGRCLPMSRDRRVKREDLVRFLASRGMIGVAAELSGGVLYVGFPPTDHEALRGSAVNSAFATDGMTAAFAIGRRRPAAVAVDGSMGRDAVKAVLDVARAGGSVAMVVGRDDVDADVYLDAGGEPADVAIKATEAAVGLA